MQLMLTSFGVSHIDRRLSGHENPFYRMPPIALEHLTAQKFLPDYSALLLADKIILDKETYNRMITGQEQIYAPMSLVLKMLYDEGLVRLEDFDSVVKANHSLLEQMLERDLKELDSWVPVLQESANIWQKYSFSPPSALQVGIKESIGKDNLPDSDKERLESYRKGLLGWFHEARTPSIINFFFLSKGARHSSRKRFKPEYRQALRERVSEYLAYINANLLLSETFDAGFYDWADMQPFYRDKFLRVARTGCNGQAEIETVKKLFEVSFPELSFWHPDNILKALKDKRIRQLRELVNQAADGEIKFNREFAETTVRKVLDIEVSIGKLRTLTSYATCPLGFIPVVGTPIQKAVEEAIIQPIIAKRRKPYRWYYMLMQIHDGH